MVIQESQISSCWCSPNSMLCTYAATLYCLLYTYIQYIILATWDMLVCISHIFQLFYTIVLYLQRVLGANGQNLVLEVAQLTAPGASLTDPADKAGLVCAAHRAGTATRAQQLPLQDTKSRCMRSAGFRAGCLLFFIFQSYFLQHMSFFCPMLSFHTIPTAIFMALCLLEQTRAAQFVCFLTVCRPRWKMFS